MSIRKHTAYNLVGALLPMALSLLTIPIYIRTVGDARYGVLAVVWAFLGYFGLFDLGLGRATAQNIAAAGNSSRKNRGDVLDGSRDKWRHGGRWRPLYLADLHLFL